MIQRHYLHLFLSKACHYSKLSPKERGDSSRSRRRLDDDTETNGKPLLPLKHFDVVVCQVGLESVSGPRFFSLFKLPRAQRHASNGLRIRVNKTASGWEEIFKICEQLEEIIRRRNTKVMSGYVHKMLLVSY